MKVSTSILSIKDNIKKNIKKLATTNTDYIHLDIMDGIFVKNKTWNFEEVKEILCNCNKPLDIHLMVEDVKTYINNFKNLNPEIITFHIEISQNVEEIINLIKSYSIKVGISIKPTTNINDIIPYLKDIDLVLIMTVEPGLGGQSIIVDCIKKVVALKSIKDLNNYHYLIEVDGGINDNTINLVKDADIVVSGSFITNSNDYEKQISKLK